MTHTPGPWFMTGSRIKAGPFGIMLENYHGAPATEWEANVRLIAAAPDLLTALKSLVAASDGHPMSIQQRCDARAVIAKAEGKS
jgi:hypothetical protein